MVGEHLTILVADDNPDCRDLYEIWLDDHAVRTTARGEAALEELDRDVDIVLLDREMPGLTGTDVAHEIAARSCTPYVVMVSSREPDFDIVEMPIDGYVQKPVQRADLLSVVDQCRTQERYQAALDEFFALTAKLATIEAEKGPTELADDDRYRQLQQRVAEKRAEVDEALRPGRTDWELAFKSTSKPPQETRNPNV